MAKQAKTKHIVIMLPIEVLGMQQTLLPKSKMLMETNGPMVVGNRLTINFM